MQDAIAYCATTTTTGDWIEPLGITTSTAIPQEVLDKLNTAGGPNSIIFGGTFGMLDFSGCVKAFPALDVGQMRCVCEVLDQERSISKLLGQIVVRADFPIADSFSMLSEWSATPTSMWCVCRSTGISQSTPGRSTH
jgi:hypothetical protein